MEIQLALVDLASFEGIKLTSEGVFNARCPANRAHSCLIRLTDTGVFAVICRECDRTPETRAYFDTVLSERFHAPYGSIPQEAVRPMTGWVRQPDGAPADAIRLMSDGEYEVLAAPDRLEEAIAWVQRFR